MTSHIHYKGFLFSMANIRDGYEKLSDDANHLFKPLLFLGVSGSHAYQTVRPDSDLDLKAVVVYYKRDLVRIPAVKLDKAWEVHLTSLIHVEVINVVDWLQKLLLGNGNRLENLFQHHILPRKDAEAGTPLVPYLWRGSEWEGLGRIHMIRRIFQKFGITQKFWHHYKGMATGQLNIYEKEKKIKAVLYAYRSALTALHLFKKGEVECGLHTLTAKYGAGYSIPRYYDEYLKTGKIPSFSMFDARMETTEILDHALTAAENYPEELATPEDFDPFNRWLWGLIQI